MLSVKLSIFRTLFDHPKHRLPRQVACPMVIQRSPRIRIVPIIFLGMVVAALVAMGVYVALNPPAVPARREQVAIAEPLTKPSPPRSDYVGSGACVECHAEIAEKYQTHSMAHSMASINAARPIEKYEAPNVIEQGPKRFFVERKGEAVVHHEQMVDAHGVIYDLALPVQYSLGSGIRGRSYLINQAQGFVQSPIGWYTAGDRWDMSPGYRETGHLRFERQVGDGCLYCHVGRVNPQGQTGQHYQDAPFAEATIGCERCHGPGGAHVAAMHQSAPGKAERDLKIVNPAHLQGEPREAVCTQCHLLGETVILRYGRGFFDFRPGDALHDVFVVYTKQPTKAETEGQNAVSQVEQMHASRCFQMSAGQLTCVSCHDPHGTPSPETRETFYRERCLKCHTDQGCSLPLAERELPPASDSCIHCHMPRAKALDVPHTSATDHRLPRKPAELHEPAPAAPLSDDEQAVAAEVIQWKVFNHAEQQLPAREANRSRGLAYAGKAMAQNSPLLAYHAEPLLTPTEMKSANSLAALVEAIGDDVEVLNALAAVYQLTDRLDQAVSLWKRVLEMSPGNEAALYRLAVHYHDGNDYVSARGYLEQLLEVRPQLADLHGRYAHVLSQFEEWPQAIEAAERGLELDPSLSQLREWLIQVYEKSDRANQAEPHRAILARIKAATAVQAKKK